MCGIIGFSGQEPCQKTLIEGLRALEYRGYDSAGIATIRNEKIIIKKSIGDISKLEKLLKESPAEGDTGIAHTRWATHGEPSLKNTHPHICCKKEIAVVHNGIVENYRELKILLESEGHKFSSETDSEIFSHLFEKYYQRNVPLEEAVRRGIKKIVGTYGLAVISKREPGKIVAAKMGSPLVLGIEKNESIVASDPAAMASRTQNVIYLEDKQLAILGKGTVKILTLDKKNIKHSIQKNNLGTQETDKGNFPSYMLKEIYEEPEAIKNTIQGRILLKKGLAKFDELNEVAKRLQKIERLIIVACGTSYYASLMGKYIIEEYADIPVEPEIASEFRHRQNCLNKKTAVIFVSQSGETADTLVAMGKVKRRGILTIGIVNTVESSLARGTDAKIYTHAGPEIGVASTKTFVSQLTVFALLSVFLGRQRNLSCSMARKILSELTNLPQKINKTLANAENIKNTALKYKDFENFFYLGRKYNYSTAMEASLKLKEISYIHAEGYAAGEMKHGPIALINENFPVFAVIPKDSVYEKTKNNLHEIRARSGRIIALTTENNRGLAGLVDDIIYIPDTLESLSSILAIVPLQLFAYYTAVLKGINPDRPRNLAKSVTVE